MSFKAYHVLVPKAAVADPEPLRVEAALLAKDRGLNLRQRWWSWRGDDWVFGFTDHLTAFFFTNCFGRFVSALKIPFPGNGDFGSKRRGSNAGLSAQLTAREVSLPEAARIAHNDCGARTVNHSKTHCCTNPACTSAFRSSLAPLA